MSWSCNTKADKETAKAKVVEWMNQNSSHYGDGPEALDVIACRDRILDSIDKIELGEGWLWDDETKQSKQVTFTKVVVEAHGSHVTTNKAISEVQFHVRVSRSV